MSPITTRRSFLALLLALTPGLANAATSDETSKGRGFLAELFDPELDLLPEYQGAKVYWLFHDNYLAARLLGRTHPEISRKINAAIRREGITKSGKIEIVFGEAENPLPFRHYELKELRRDGAKIIRTEVVTGKPLVGWENYADLLLLATMAEQDQTKARQHWELAMKMWDGKGFFDAAARHSHLYATYKLGLGLLAASRLSPLPKVPAGLREKLLSLQSSSGGWITDYDPSGKPVGFANVETTCLSVLGLEASTT